MNISFQCDVCSKPLSANAIAAGRVITCPFCHHTTKIPKIEEQKRVEASSKTGKSNTEIKSSPKSDFSQWRDPTFDPDWEKMLEKFPNFKPNPFGISFPLDKAILEANSNEEYNEEEDFDASNGSTASQYSVDDLIKGVD